MVLERLPGETDDKGDAGGVLEVGEAEHCEVLILAPKDATEGEVGREEREDRRIAEGTPVGDANGGGMGEVAGVVMI